MIIDNTTTGQTLAEHGLEITDVLLESSTRFIANPAALADGWKRRQDRGTEDAFRGRPRRPEAGHAGDERPSGEAGRGRPDPALHEVADGLLALPGRRLRGQGGRSQGGSGAGSSRVLKRLGATDILEYEFRKVVL